MPVDVEEVYELIIEEWNNLTFHKKDSKDGIVRFDAMAGLTGIDDDVCISVQIGDQIMAVDFIFDYINATEEAYQLINKFNQENLCYKAYIRQDGFLVIDYHSPVVTLEQAAKEFTFAMVGLTDDSIMDTLIPLSKLTFSEGE